MTAYDLMIKTNHHLIKGGDLTEAQKRDIVCRFLAARSTAEQAQRFYRGVKYPNNIDGEGRRMYPVFYIPPYNGGKKLKTIYDKTPGTHILSANMYELEIIRLLHLFAPDDPEIRDMVAKTLERLKTTCFANRDDGLGECFDTSLVVLRFLAAVSSDTAWIQSRIDNHNNHVTEKKRSRYTKWYFWLCLLELPFDIAEPELIKYQNEMLMWLTDKGKPRNGDMEIDQVILCSLQNSLIRFRSMRILSRLI